jgi:hypothetical protein
LAFWKFSMLDLDVGLFYSSCVGLNGFVFFYLEVLGFELKAYAC